MKTPPDVALAMAGLLLAVSWAEAKAVPSFRSLYPLGGQQGTAVEVYVTGSNLEDAYAVWFGGDSQLYTQQISNAAPGSKISRSADGLLAQIKTIEEGIRACIQLSIPLDARVGRHSLWLVSPHGLSNRMSFWVSSHATIQETTQPHSIPDEAQPITLPVDINGRISEHGQLDYYSFEVARPQTLAFEVLAFQGAGFDPQLGLFTAPGSFFDPRRAKRLLCREEMNQGPMPSNRRLTYHFTKPGRYLVHIASVFTRGGPDFSYLIRIAAAEQTTRPDNATAWAQQRLQAIHARAIEPLSTPNVTHVLESNTAENKMLFTIPAVLEGTISQPGEIDTFRFKGGAGQKVAFEVDTPLAQSPYFNPRLDVLDASGKVVISNLQSKDGVISRAARSATGVLAQEGEYRLRVRDVTSIQGSPDHIYRVLVRNQIPHVGSFSVQDGERINLAPGAMKELPIRIALEEGLLPLPVLGTSTVGLLGSPLAPGPVLGASALFPGRAGFFGEIAIAAEGLPQGVKAHFDKAGSKLVLTSDKDTPRTLLPQLIRITGRLRTVGKEGPSLPVREIPLMVIKK